ncbi:PTPRB [Branchiostoma lanceolatum]|uniref:PTPRB protein n=1 Tax=Branchiostoma lanceolatum TaxID=7740 RepID=A0A8J9ZDC9_BRALA|nr:PTPRB [Branchiostoma lanceolatum]
MEKDRPKSVIKPGVVVNVSSLVVSWEPGDESATKYDVSVCGHDIPTKSIMADSGDFIQCELENLLPNTEYKIQIVAVRDKTSGDPVFVNAKTKICPFKHFKFPSSTESTIDIECPEPQGPKDVYYVSLHECRDRESRGDLVKEERMKAEGRLFHSFTGLVPGRRYRATAKCGSGGVWSEEKTVDISTKVARPTNFKILYETQTSAKVQWDHPAGDRDWYILRTVPEGETVTCQTISVNGHETSYTIEDLEPGTEYNVYLQTTSKGDKTEPVTVIYTTFPAKVENVRLSSDEPGTLSVDWDEAPGRKDYYALSIDRGWIHERIQPRVEQSPVGPRWIRKDLVPLARYVVTVTTCSGDKRSEECRDVQVIKPHPPQIKVKDEDITSNSVHLSWSKGEGSREKPWNDCVDISKARVRNYIVSISPKHATPSTVIKTPKEIKDCPGHTFTNLQSGTEYTLSVRVQYSNKVSFNSEEVMTVEAECTSWTPPEKPGPLQIEDISPTTFKVSWSPSNGRVDHYLIEMTSEGMTSELKEGIPKRWETTKGTTCTFKNVNTFVAYVITLRAVSGPRKSEAVFGEKRPVYEDQQGPLVFLSHAGEDKEAFVEPLLVALFEEGLSESDIFFDKFSISTGDTIRKEIVSAISNKTLKLFVIVVSKHFFGERKYWPRLEYELSLQEHIPLYPIWLDDNDDSFKSFSSFVGENSSLLKGKRAFCVGYSDNAEEVKKAAREIASKVSPWLKPRKTTTAGPEPSGDTAAKGTSAQLPCAVPVPHPTEGTSTVHDAPEQGDSRSSFDGDVPQDERHGEETTAQAQGDDDVNKLAMQIQDMEQSGWEVVTLMINKKTGEERTAASSACLSFLESNPDISTRFKQFVKSSNETEPLCSDNSHAG